MAIDPAQSALHTVSVVAHNEQRVTEMCLSRVRASGFTGELILLDNGSTPSLRSSAAKYSCVFIRNDVNEYVNPAWNHIIEICKSRYLTLLNNDCLVRDGYLDQVTDLMQVHQLGAASPSFEVVRDITLYDGNTIRERQAPIIDHEAMRQGYCMTIDLEAYRECDYQIPSSFLIWYGDDWIWGQLRRRRYPCVVIKNRTCVCEIARTCNYYPEVHEIIRRDVKRAQECPIMREMRILAGSLA